MLPPLRNPSLHLHLPLRPFSTTSLTASSLKSKLLRRAALASSPPPSSSLTPPPYPYGRSTTYKQSNTGLYGTSRILFGNTVSTKIFKSRARRAKTRRSWALNLHRKRLWSDALGAFVRVKVQARVLRTIDKVGGLDEYLLGEGVGRVKELGVQGWGLRARVLGTERVRERFRGERERWGLVQGGVEVEVEGGEQGEGVKVREYVAGGGGKFLERDVSEVVVEEPQSVEKDAPPKAVLEESQPMKKDTPPEAVVQEEQPVETEEQWLVRERPREEAAEREEKPADQPKEKKSWWKRWLGR